MLKTLSRRLSKMRGFTMIELLVVIAIIGVLAVAVLSAINPIEQINKGRDTRTRSDAAELLGSIERYFTTQEQYPWNTTQAAAAPYAAWTGVVLSTAAFDTNVANGFPWLQTLQISNEVKPAFAQRLYNTYNGVIGANNVFLAIKAVDSDELRVCFLPTSAQFKLEAVRKCCLASSVTPACSEPAALSLKGSTPASVTGSNGAFTLCPSTDGSFTSTDRFFICLP